MSSSSIEFHKIWVDQCAATEGIRDHFGLENAMDYLIGEKLFMFLMASECDAQFAAEVPTFVAEIQRIFTTAEISDYLDQLKRGKYLAPPDPDLDINDLDDGIEDEPWHENPVMGAEELLRFSRVRQLLQLALLGRTRLLLLTYARQPKAHDLCPQFFDPLRRICRANQATTCLEGHLSSASQPPRLRHRSSCNGHPSTCSRAP